MDSYFSVIVHMNSSKYLQSSIKEGSAILGNIDLSLLPNNVLKFWYYLK